MKRKDCNITLSARADLLELQSFFVPVGRSLPPKLRCRLHDHHAALSACSRKKLAVSIAVLKHPLLTSRCCKSTAQVARVPVWQASKLSSSGALQLQNSATPARRRRTAPRPTPPASCRAPRALALWTGLGLGSSRMDDAGYREVAERALGYARVEFRDEIASLKRENAALKRKVGRKPRGGGSAAGHGPVVEDDPDSSSLLLAVKRARTLALFLLLLSCTTAILEGYEETLAAHVSLSFFVPFLIGHGGNCGGMSVGAVISAIARGDARTPSSKYRLALREILAGCAVAVQLGPSRPSPCT